MLFSIGAPTKLSSKVKIRIKHKLLNETIKYEVLLWSKVFEIKQRLQLITKIHPKFQRLFYSNKELKNNKALDYYGIKKNSLLLMTLKIKRKDKTFLKVLEVFKERISPNYQNSLNKIETAFKQGIKPKLTESGTSGSYFLKDNDRKNIAIFKPSDEEPYTPNNPKGYTGKFGGEGFRKGIRSGESAEREVAAFLLDKKGFHDVPETYLVEIVNSFFVNSKTKTKIDDDNEDENSKYGSLQLFANHMDNAGNYGYMMFSEKEVHKIAILDIRILNCDRNEENILLKKVLRRNHNNINNNNNKNDKSNIEFQLIPIDHGLAFPDQISICNCEIVWMEWPQVQHPFSLEEIEFIKNINPKEDVKFLHKHLKMREICLRNFRIAEILLKKCAENGLTLYDIGNIIYKEEPENTSIIERIIQDTEYLYFSSKSEANHLKFYEEIMKKKKFKPINNNKKSILFNNNNKNKRKNQLTKDDNYINSPKLKNDYNENTSKRTFFKRNLSNLDQIKNKQEFQSKEAMNSTEIIEESENSDESEVSYKRVNDIQKVTIPALLPKIPEQIIFNPEEKLTEKINEFRLTKCKENEFINANLDQEFVLQNDLQLKKTKSHINDQIKLTKHSCDDKNDCIKVLNDIKSNHESPKKILKKMMSLPNLRKILKEDEFPKEKGKKDQPKIYDEIFFHIFEGELERYLLLIKKRNRLSSFE